MTKPKRSTRVPKAQIETYDRLTALTDEFSHQHLHEDYAELARHAIAALCRKRPSPLRSGRPNTWACGVIYALGQVNFLFDKDSDPHMSAADLCRHFNIATSTGGNKAKQIRKALGMDRFDFTWALPEVIDRFSVYWMIQVNGLLVDAREMPREVQEEAFDRGMIPYVHADKESQAQLARRKKILARYDLYREISSEHQSGIVADIIDEDVLEIALRIGLLETPEELAEKSIDELVPAFDLALYAIDEGDGKGRDNGSLIAHKLEAWPKALNRNERIMFEAMSRSLFSIFEVVGQHDVAGLVMRDLFSNEELWLIDRGLEAKAPDGLKIAIRLIHPEDFWMSTGANIIVNDEMLEDAKRAFQVEKGEHPHPDHLAEFLFKDHFARSYLG